MKRLRSQGTKAPGCPRSHDSQLHTPAPKALTRPAALGFTAAAPGRRQGPLPRRAGSSPRTRRGWAHHRDSGGRLPGASWPDAEWRGDVAQPEGAEGTESGCLGQRGEGQTGTSSGSAYLGRPLPVTLGKAKEHWPRAILPGTQRHQGSVQVTRLERAQLGKPHLPRQRGPFPLTHILESRAVTACLR